MAPRRDPPDMVMITRRSASPVFEHLPTWAPYAGTDWEGAVESISPVYMNYDFATPGYHTARIDMTCSGGHHADGTFVLSDRRFPALRTIKVGDRLRVRIDAQGKPSVEIARPLTNPP